MDEATEVMLVVLALTLFFGGLAMKFSDAILHFLKMDYIIDNTSTGNNKKIYFKDIKDKN